MSEKNNQKKRSVNTHDIPMTGKIPPQAREIEEAILGAIMLQRDAYDEAANILRPDMFYVDGHRKIFQAMREMAASGMPIDFLTVVEQLTKNGTIDEVGGPYYVTKLTNTVVNAANIQHHCRIVMQKYMSREMIRIGSEIVADAFSDAYDPFDMLENAEKALTDIMQTVSSGEMSGIDTVLVEALQKIEQWRQNDSHITGVPSDIPDLDRVTRGWQPGDLIIIAARPSVGKTAFAMNLIRNAARHTTVAAWSLEMKAYMLVLRMLAAESKEFLTHLLTGRISDERMRALFEGAVRRLAGLKIFFDDNSDLTIQRLRSKARKLKRKNKLGLIVVDYLQLMSGDERTNNREQEISKISRNLKKLAMELQVPIIALSQLSREVEKRTTGVPQLSDLRESGSIEQDADSVIFLWGPTDSQIMDDESLLTRRYIRVAKARNGALATIELDFKSEIQLFEAIETTTLGPGSWKAVQPVRETRDITSASRFNDSTDSPF